MAITPVDLLLPHWVEYKMSWFQVLSLQSCSTLPAQTQLAQCGHFLHLGSVFDHCVHFIPFSFFCLIPKVAFAMHKCCVATDLMTAVMLFPELHQKRQGFNGSSIVAFHCDNTLIP